MKKNSLLKTASPYLLFAAMCIILMFAVDGTFQNGAVSGSNMVLINVICALAAVIAAAIGALALRKQLTDQKLIFLMLLAGFLLRLAYVIYNPYYDRQHDVQTINHTDGHAGYILWLVNNNFRLPDTDPTMVYQFYHPPFYYYVAAFIIKILTGLGLSLESSFESLQILPLFLSCCIMLINLRIFKELGLRSAALRVACAIMFLHPTFYFMAGFLNNDMMSLLFIFSAILFTIRWYKNPTLKRILPIAVCIGLGMMSKLSGALIAPAVAFVFFTKLWQTRKNQPLKIIGQFAAFGAVCAPLGLWWGIRNLIMFGTPITYVPPAGDMPQYIGDFSPLQRLLGFQIKFPFISMPYFNDYLLRGETLEYGIFAALIKTSIFGEWTLGTPGQPITVLSYFLFWLAVGIAAFSLFAMTSTLVRAFETKSKDLVIKVMFAVIFLTLIINQIIFCLDAPFVCTQNFRYIVPSLLTGCVFIGYWLAAHEQPKKLVRAVRVTAISAAALFCVLSAVIYIMLYLSAAAV